MMSQKHRYLSFSLSLTTLSGALMISSGLVLHICVGAMLLMGPSKNTYSQTMEYESETEHNKHPTDRNAEKETSGPTNQINYDSKAEKSAKQMAFTLFSNPSFIFLVCNCFAFQFGNAVVYTHIVAFAASESIDESLRNTLVSALGLSSLISRVVLSMLSQHPRINTIILYTTIVVICGKLYDI